LDDGFSARQIGQRDVPALASTLIAANAGKLQVRGHLRPDQTLPAVRRGALSSQPGASWAIA
jgi:hypothetical protein